MRIYVNVVRIYGKSLENLLLTYSFPLPGLVGADRSCLGSISTFS